MIQKLLQTYRFQQSLMAKEEMQLALKILQMPLFELDQMIEAELEDNPLVGYEEEAQEFDPPEIEVSDEGTPFESLFNQAKRHFSTQKELHIAQVIIGSLESDGMLKTPLNELALLARVPKEEVSSVLAIIKTFDPSGIASQSIQELLLVQLKRDSFTYEVIAHFFDDLMKGKFSSIAKALQVTEEIAKKRLRKELLPLKFHPINSGFTSNEAIISDIVISDELEITVPGANWPPIEIKPEYQELLSGKGDKELQSYLKLHLQKLKWLYQCIDQRASHLEKIAKHLMEYAPEYFTGEMAHYPPLSMSTLAEKLGVHVSTISRAVSNKYIETPRGTYPLKSFFQSSQERTKQLIKEILEKHGKLTDQQLADLLQEKGVSLSRRTVAKYRKSILSCRYTG